VSRLRESSRPDRWWRRLQDWAQGNPNRQAAFAMIAVGVVLILLASALAIFAL
jgi:hypothetical protein